MGQPTIRIKRSSDEKFYFVLVADNAKIVATSETYESKQACKDGITSVCNIVTSATIIDETI